MNNNYNKNTENKSSLHAVNNARQINKNNNIVQ